MRVLITLHLLLAAACNVQAAQETQLFALAQLNADKFMAELPELPRLFTLRYRPIVDPTRTGEYDAVRKMLVFNDGIQIISSDWVFERCKPSGSFIGGNAYGVQMKVQRMQCERLEIMDSELLGATFGNRIEIPIEPNDYRALKTAGMRYELAVNIGEQVSKEVFTKTTFTTRASAGNPVEKRITVLRAHGKMISLILISPSGRSLGAELQRRE